MFTSMLPKETIASATFQPTDVMVVEWAYNNIPGTFFGGNGAGQTGPTYVRSTTCAVPEPVDLATIGFPLSHWAMTVNANAGPPVTGGLICGPT